MEKPFKPDSAIEELSPEELKRALRYAREGLKDIQLYLEEFSAFLPLAIINVNPLGFVLDANKALKDLVGRKRAEIIGKSIEGFFLEKKRFNTLQQKVLQGKYAEGEEMTLLSKIGKIPISIYLAPRKDRKNNIIGYFVGISDVTKFKGLEQALEKRVKQRTNELERRTQELIDSRRALLNILEDVEATRTEAIGERDKTLAIIENFADGLLLLEEEKITLFNPKAKELFGLQKEKVIGKKVFELGKNRKVEPLIKLIKEKGMELSREKLSLGDDLALEVSTIPILRGQEETGRMIIFHDVTREKFIERMKTEFVSIAAHQLRTPLSAIKWILKMLLEGDLGPLSPTQKDFIGKTYESNERMIKLVSDLLDVARIEEGRFLYNLEKEDIIEVITKAILPLEGISQRKKISLEFKKPAGDIPKTYIDPDRIILALQNLVDNAIRYTKQGKVCLTLEYSKEKSEFLVKIEDSGIGIPEDQQTRVFGRFFRGGNAVKIDTLGTGLGLFIAKNIIEAHQGKIWFESQEGKGTTFYFTLPLRLRQERI